MVRATSDTGRADWIVDAIVERACGVEAGNHLTSITLMERNSTILRSIQINWQTLIASSSGITSHDSGN